jgi:hypothetical protein
MSRALPVRSIGLARPRFGASFRAAATLAALFVGGCADTPKEAKQESKAPENASVANEVTKKAKVESVDKATRTVVLLAEDGKKVPVVCGPEVRNFDQIAVGDTVAVRYHESLAVALVKPGGGSSDSVALVAGRAPVGGQPGAAIGGQITQTVKIESVDLTNHVVVFTPQAGGEKQTLPVKRDEGKAFIAGLKPGDLVEITYTQAIAIAVEKQ